MPGKSFAMTNSKNTKIKTNKKRHNFSHFLKLNVENYELLKIKILRNSIPIYHLFTIRYTSHIPNI